MQNEDFKLYFENALQEKITNFSELAASGSSRKNCVVCTAHNKYILTFNENVEENESFFYFSKIFQAFNFNSPKIITVSKDRKTYVQSYLGDNTLSEIIANEKQTNRVTCLVKQSLDKLFELQKSTENKIDYTNTFEYTTYDSLPILHDFNYFKFLFVDVLGLSYHKSALLQEFNALAKEMETLQPRGIMIRDFQSRNIMVDHKDAVYFIDYQSAMEGPLIYDVVSFLFQAKANFQKEFRQEMLHYYFSKFETEKQIQLKKSLPFIQFIRFVQVLGAYGFRGLVQRKKHFVESIPQGVENLISFAESWEELEKFPEFKSIIQQLKSTDLSLKKNKY